MSATSEGIPFAGLARSSGVVRALVNRRTAVPISLGLALVVGTGDFLTGADVAFTLLYLLPIGIATWYRGRHWSIGVSSFCVALWLGIATMNAPRKLSHDLTMLWNTVGQAGVFFAFATVLQSLRARIDVEVQGRASAEEQLRHAERLTTVGLLASGIAHELGTPLNVISGRATLIASERATGDAARSSATVIVEQAKRMAGIVRGLLDFARRGDAPKVAVDIRQIATETVALLQPLANRRGCTIVLSARAPAVASVDAGQIRQVLTNLLMNAVQAMTEGGAIRVSVDVAPDASPPPHVQPARGWIAIHVRDEGPGIAPEILAHVFDPFFTTKDVGEGTGLGLSIAFGIVRDHGGWIDVQSRIGRGAELVVHLPQAGAA